MIVLANYEYIIQRLNVALFYFVTKSLSRIKKIEE